MYQHMIIVVGQVFKKWRDQGDTDGERDISLFSLLAAGMLGFFLNAISIVSFLTVKEMRNPSNFFVFNLAVADLSLNINGLAAAYASYIRYESIIIKPPTDALSVPS